MRAAPCLLALIALSAAAAQAEGTAPGAPVETMLYPLRSLGIAPEATAALEQTLRNEAAGVPEVKLISAQALAASLAKERDPDCLQRLACAASAASRAGAKQFVVGTVSGLGDAVLVDLKLVDARSGEELRRITHPITGKQDLLIETLHAAAVELLAPARFTGRLEVELVESGEGAAPVPAPASESAGCTLYLDGKRVASLPLAGPIEGLAPGKRALRVSKEGFRDASLFVEIRFERTTRAYIDLPHGELARVAFLRPADSARAPEPADHRDARLAGADFSRAPDAAAQGGGSAARGSKGDTGSAPAVAAAKKEPAPAAAKPAAPAPATSGSAPPAHTIVATAAAPAGTGPSNAAASPSAPPESVAVARAPEPRGPWMKIGGWSALGLGAAALAGAIAVHVKAYQTASGLDAREATNSLGPSDASLYGDVYTEVQTARVLYVVAGVLGAGGGALLLWDHHLDAQRAALSAQPLVVEGGGGAGVAGRF